MTIPNAVIIEYDDYVEIEIANVYSGDVLTYHFYPDGRVLEYRRCVFSGDRRIMIETRDVFGALARIADWTVDNVTELGNDDGA